MYQHTSYKGPRNGFKITAIICITFAALYAVFKTELFPVLLYLIGATTFAGLVAEALFRMIAHIENPNSRFGRR